MTDSTTPARALDWRARFDPRSLNYKVADAVPALKTRSRTWKRDTWLDQGQEGACVGFSCAHALATTPRRHLPQVTQTDAFNIYRDAQRHDQWPGEDYEGSSVLGGMQALVAEGSVSRYLWATTTEEVIHAVGYLAPVVIGINWYEDMFDPDAEGFLHKSGRLAGGHAILIGGVSLTKEAFLLYNSWGKDWGVNGGAWVSFTDMDALLHEDGEFAVPTKVVPPKAA